MEGHLHHFLDFVLPPEKRYLGAILLVSLFGHLLCFFIFRIEAIPANRPLRAPLQVTLASIAPTIDQNKEGSVSFLDVRSPSIFAIPSVLPGDEKRMMGLPRIYAPPLDLLADSKLAASMGLSASLEAVESRASRAVAGARTAPMPISIETPPPLSGSSFLVSGPVSERSIIRKPDLPRPESKNILGCTGIQIQVNQRGLVEFAEVDESCSDSSIDQLGVKVARALIFSRSFKDNPALQQGKVTIYWDFVEKSSPLEINSPPVAPVAPSSGGGNP